MAFAHVTWDSIWPQHFNLRASFDGQSSTCQRCFRLRQRVENCHDGCYLLQERCLSDLIHSFYNSCSVIEFSSTTERWSRWSMSYCHCERLVWGNAHWRCHASESSCCLSTACSFQFETKSLLQQERCLGSTLSYRCALCLELSCHYRGQLTCSLQCDDDLTPCYCPFYCRYWSCLMLKRSTALAVVVKGESQG